MNTDNQVATFATSADSQPDHMIVKGEDRSAFVASDARAQDAHTADRPSPHDISREQWIQILCVFVCFFNTWGLLLSFGGLQEFYATVLLSNESSSDIAWIPTVYSFILLSGGIVTGPLFDAGYFHHLLVLGSLLQVFGLMMTSISREYYQIFLSQGLCVGIGVSLVYVPSISAAGASFDNELRPKIIGLVSSATGIGGVIYPIVFRQLLPLVGFGWSVRVVAFIMLATYILAYGVLFFPPKRSPKIRSWFDASMLKDPPFLVFMVCGFLSGAAYYMPSLYIPIFARTEIFGDDDNALSFYLLSIINGASTLGRLIIGPIAANLEALRLSAEGLSCRVWCCSLGYVSRRFPVLSPGQCSGDSYRVW